MIRRRLLTWYDRQGRRLPWRETRDPYHIWLSEIMLQQTQVATVIPYYKRFLKAFPTIPDLAEAPPHKAIKLWEGLGYYTRVRNLHKAAQIILEEYGGKLPENKMSLEQLPGIGRSTAGAILSLAFEKRAAILDGNVRRVLCRLFAIDQNPQKPEVIKVLWEYSHILLPMKRVSDFNQALMDLGAMVCQPKRPQCPSCPLERLCLAHAEGREDKLPIRPLRKTIPHRHFVVGVIRRQGSLLIQQRPDRGLLGGLWEFPTFEVNPSQQRREDHLHQELKKGIGIEVEIQASLSPIRHTYSHFKATYYPFLCRPIKGQKRLDDLTWAPPQKIQGYPLSSVYQKILRQAVYSIFPSSNQLGLFKVAEQTNI